MYPTSDKQAGVHMLYSSSKTVCRAGGPCAAARDASHGIAIELGAIKRFDGVARHQTSAEIRPLQRTGTAE
jgi:hypothetical protein